MVDPKDWRLQGQERYLKGAALARRRYERNASKAERNHDHCEFCGAKFMGEDMADVLHEGYCSADQYRWICVGCFNDFKEYFEWKVEEPA